MLWGFDGYTGSFVLLLGVNAEKHVVIETVAPEVTMLAKVEVNLCSFRQP